MLAACDNCGLAAEDVAYAHICAHTAKLLWACGTSASDACAWLVTAHAMQRVPPMCKVRTLHGPTLHAPPPFLPSSS
eukprot:77808-Chlamydomonas_euryale.AAC.1